MMSSRSVPRSSFVTLVFLISGGLANAQFDARVQAVHNSPDPELAVVDLYVAGELAVDDVAFRTASPFIDVFALFPLTGGVAPGNSTGPEDVFFEFPITLTPGETYQLVAVGVRDPGQFLPNPDGVDIGLDVVIIEQAREAANDPGMVDVLTVHGSPDAPTLDVLQGPVPGARSAGPLVFGDNLAFKDVSTYVPIDESAIVLEFESSDGTTISQVYQPFTVDLGDVITVMASGFLDPDQNQNGPEFAPLVVFVDGSSIVLQPETTSIDDDGSRPVGFALHGNYPNPFNPSTTITFDLAAAGTVRVEVVDVLGQSALTTSTTFFPAGSGHELQLDARSLPSGVYVYRVLAVMTGNMQTETGRMTLLK